MKALCIAVIASSVLIGVGAALYGDGLGTGIATTGSPHNFVDDIGVAELPGSGGWNGREEICRVCHVPHDHDRAQHYGDVGLLWNHAVSDQAWPMYSSTTLDGATSSQPTGYSKMCLGCHDGSVAVDTFDKYAGGTVFIADYNSGFQVPGASYGAGGFGLQNTHPISIDYDEVADPKLQPKDAPMGSSGTIADVLENGVTLQCSSCHDVHDQEGESVPGTHLLRVNMKASTGPASGLCLACHIK